MHAATDLGEPIPAPEVQPGHEPGLYLLQLRSLFLLSLRNGGLLLPGLACLVFRICARLERFADSKRATDVERVPSVERTALAGLFGLGWRGERVVGGV